MPKGKKKKLVLTSPAADPARPEDNDQKQVAVLTAKQIKAYKEEVAERVRIRKAYWANVEAEMKETEMKAKAAAKERRARLAKLARARRLRMKAREAAHEEKRRAFRELQAAEAANGIVRPHCGDPSKCYRCRRREVKN